MMLRHIFAVIMVLFSVHAWAEEGAKEMALSEAPINRSDIESIKRGAKFFAANCMSCHTMVYLRYDKLAQEAGITYDKMPINVKTWPYNVTPPDLSLEADIRGVDWIYTYLHSFYQDRARPTGMNNLLVPNTAMPGIISAFQGDQTLNTTPPETGVFSKELHYYDLVTLVREGSMTPDQFDAATADVVNFLAYAAEPYRAEQHRIGWWVLGFLVILFVLTYLLKKEYWKDVKKRRHD